MTKECKECKLEQPLSEFYVTHKRYGTLTPRCKKCHSRYVNSRKRREAQKISQYEGPKVVKESAIKTLQAMGYDTTIDVHPQFMVRFNKWLANRSSKS